MDGKSSRQEAVRACLRQISTHPDFPAFTHQISRVMQVLGDEEASLRRLTALILRDYSLTLKILRIVNSIHYNRSGKPILSVTHAVALLGVDAIRHIAGSLILFEHYRKKSPALAQLMLLSLLTANQAREVAGLLRYPRREEAYICGMFRNLGEVLVACYLQREYASILVRMNEGRLTEREAALEVLSFTYEDLGQAAASQWNLPEKVIACISAPGLRRAGTRSSELAVLSAVTAFSHGLTTAVYRRDSDGARARLKRLVNEYGPALGLQTDDVRSVLDSAILETKETFSLLRVPLDDLKLRRQTETVLAGLDEAAPREVAPVVPPLSCGGAVLEQLVHEVEWVVSSGSDWDLNNVILMILEAIYRSEVFDRVLFCLVNPDRSVIQGRIGLGEGSEELRDKFRFPLTPRGGPISAALVAQQDLLLSPERGLCYPEVELLEKLGAPSIGVLPIVVDGVLVGCLYCDRLAPGPDPDPRILELVSRLRCLAARAISIKKPSSV